MKISIDHDRCEGHGMCAITAPRVFSLDDNGLVQYHAAGQDAAGQDAAGQDVPEAEVPAVQSAIDVCPVAALRRV